MIEPGEIIINNHTQILVVVNQLKLKPIKQQTTIGQILLRDDNILSFVSILSEDGFQQTSH